MSLNIEQQAAEIPESRSRLKPNKSRTPAKAVWQAIVRLNQIVICSILLLFLSPLLVFVAVLVKINSTGPLFYYGTRVGRGSNLFKVIKFRTLPVQYESMVGDRILSPRERSHGLIPTIVTRAKLDELPQFLNVLKGEMSFVGPRPVRPVIVSKYAKDIPTYAKKFMVKPGITGLAQIIGGYYMAPKDKHKYDMIYIKNMSIILDIKIIFLTFAVLVLSRRIMKSALIETFLGFKLGVQLEEIEQTQDVFDNVTKKTDKV